MLPTPGIEEEQEPDDSPAPQTKAKENSADATAMNEDGKADGGGPAQEDEGPRHDLDCHHGTGKAPHGPQEGLQTQTTEEERIAQEESEEKGSDDEEDTPEQLTEHEVLEDDDNDEGDGGREDRELPKL